MSHFPILLIYGILSYGLTHICGGLENNSCEELLRLEIQMRVDGRRKGELNYRHPNKIRSKKKVT